MNNSVLVACEKDLLLSIILNRRAAFFKGVMSHIYLDFLNTLFTCIQSVRLYFKRYYPAFPK